MDDPWEQLVRERTYAIWLREGSPDGHAEQFWLMAEEELLAEGHSRPSRQRQWAEQLPGDERKADERSDP